VAFKALEKPLLKAGVPWLGRAFTKSIGAGAVGGGVEATVRTGNPSEGLKGAEFGAKIGAIPPALGVGARTVIPFSGKVAKHVVKFGWSKYLDHLRPVDRAMAEHGMERAYARWHEIVSSGESALQRMTPNTVKKFREVRANAAIAAGKKWDEYYVAFKNLSPWERHAARGIVEGKLSAAKDLDGLVDPERVPLVQGAASTLRGLLDDIRTRATALKVPMKGSDDELYSFSGLDDYFPHKIVNTRQYVEDGPHKWEAIRDVKRAHVQRATDAFNEIQTLKAQKPLISAAFKSGAMTPKQAFDDRRKLAAAIRAQNNIVKKNPVKTDKDAEMWLNKLHEEATFGAKSGRSGAPTSAHLKARSIGLPGYELDPDLVIPQYLESMERRIAMTETFGPKGGGLMPELPEGAPLEQMFPGAYEEWMAMPDGPMKESAKKVTDRVFGKNYETSGLFEGVRPVANALMNLQVISRLTFSALNQPSQIIMGGAAAGWRGLANNTLKMMYRDPDVASVARRSGAILHGAVRNANSQLYGETTGKFAQAAQQRLKDVGMTQADLGARVTGAMQGHTTAMYQARRLMEAEKQLSGPLNKASQEFYQGQLQKISAKLQELGINPQEVLSQGGQLTDDQLLRAANSAAFDVNFWGDALSMPGFFASPEARFLLQFKSFLAQNTILMKNRFVKPAMKWVETGGKEGSIAPTVKMIGAMGLWGEATADVRAFLQNKERPKEAKERLIENFAQAGTMGLFYDGMFATQKGWEGLITYAVGPSLTTAAKGGYAAIRAAQGNPKYAAKFLIRDVAPLAGPLPALVAPGVERGLFPPRTGAQPLLREEDLRGLFEKPDTLGGF
jgi:hypothetical protein